MLLRKVIWLVEFPLNLIAELCLYLESAIITILQREREETIRSSLDQVYELLSQQRRATVVSPLLSSSPPSSSASLASSATETQSRARGSNSNSSSRNLSDLLNRIISRGSDLSIYSLAHSSRHSIGPGSSGVGGHSDRRGWWHWLWGFGSRSNRKGTISHLLQSLEKPLATPAQAQEFLSPVPDSPAESQINNDHTQSEDHHHHHQSNQHFLSHYMDNQVSPSFIFSLWDRRLMPSFKTFFNLASREEGRKSSSNYLMGKRKKTLVLDLDETLVHATTVSTRDCDYMMEVLVGNIACLYYVSKRPFVDVFLEHARQWFNLVVYTASVPEYADSVIDWLDDGRNLFSQRLFRSDCVLLDFDIVSSGAAAEINEEDDLPVVFSLAPTTIMTRSRSKRNSNSNTNNKNKNVNLTQNQRHSDAAEPSRKKFRTFVKDLTKVDTDLRHVFLVDNSHISFEMQPENGYLVSSWFNDNKNDRVLLDIIPLLEALYFTNDVRSILSLRLFKQQ